MGSPLYSEGSYHFDTQDVGRPKKGQEARARDEKEPIGSFFNSGNRYALKKKSTKNSGGHSKPSCYSSLNWGVQAWAVQQSGTPGFGGGHEIKRL